MEIELKKLKNVFHYNESYAKYMLADEKKYTINLPKEVYAETEFRDYNLRILKKINKLLCPIEAELYLEPNLFISNECGKIYFKEDSKKLEKAKQLKFCKSRKDKYVKAEDAFWNDHYLKLFGSIRKAVEAEDVVQFREYLRSIESIFIAIRCARKNDLSKKYTSRDYNKYRFLRIYSSSMKWILQLKS